MQSQWEISSALAALNCLGKISLQRVALIFEHQLLIGELQGKYQEQFMADLRSDFPSVQTGPNFVFFLGVGQVFKEHLSS